MTGTDQIFIDQYRYHLPQSAIARYPLQDREQSKLLVYKKGMVGHRKFYELPVLLPEGSWLVFNNTKVIQARLTFHKPTGARIEVFCLEPVKPAEYQMSFESTRSCTWKCMVGNAKKWKSGSVSLQTRVSGKDVVLNATAMKAEGDSFIVRFEWDAEQCVFSEIIESAGSTPIPPYLNRKAEESDKVRYQTVYSRDPGSVAAPTAGLHFTTRMMKQLKDQGIETCELTLHVGAGTFVPVKQENARHHAMHAETVLVSKKFLEAWAGRETAPLAVGTTSTRSLETLYWLGVRLLSGKSLHPVLTEFKQWENDMLPQDITLQESLGALIGFCQISGINQFRFSTSLMIVPGYRFRTIRGLITNFHMPGSTLLLLIAALIGEDWKKVYREAMENNYRFLSYGDSSMLLPESI
ncbi:MAG: S-adenosylmethionine:tRNA ribosyltransferase-isomerase [Bacteroidota bacterium]